MPPSSPRPFVIPLAAIVLFATVAVGVLLTIQSFQSPPPVPTIDAKLSVREGRFIVPNRNGVVASDDELIGTVLQIDMGERLDVRIDGVVPRHPAAANGVVLYELSSRNAATGRFEPLCEPDVRGDSLGLPLEGMWNERGDYVDAPGRFEIACTSGATGKCVMMGYLPWRSTQMRQLHQACTRMIRADYCGDGSAHTKDGTLIHVSDRLGIWPDGPTSTTVFEAGWAPDGAVCVARTRIPSILDLDTLRAQCPERFNKPPGSCSELDAQSDTRAILFNRH